MAGRIEALKKMLERNPDDARVRFGLASEYEKEGRWEDVVRELQLYLSATDDQGNAWGRLADALRKLGREEESKEALRRGVDAARRHGHPSMAAEFEERLND